MKKNCDNKHDVPNNFNNDKFGTILNIASIKNLIDAFLSGKKKYYIIINYGKIEKVIEIDIIAPLLKDNIKEIFMANFKYACTVAARNYNTMFRLNVPINVYNSQTNKIVTKPKYLYGYPKNAFECAANESCVYKK